MNNSIIVKCLTILAIVLANSLSSQELVETAPNQLALTLDTESGQFYSIRQSTNLQNIASTPILAQVEGDDSTTSPLLGINTQSNPSAFFLISREPQTAHPTASANTLLNNKTFLGINLLPSNRWNFFGSTGDWSYQVNTAQTATIIMTFDEFGNDPANGTLTFELDFGNDGDLTTVEFDADYYGEPTNEQESGTIDLSQDSFAPSLLLKDVLGGDTYLGYDFTSETRFIWNNSEPGNYTVQRPDDDTVKLILTYDEDGNNPTVYREEITITFNGTATVPVYYEEYISNSLSASYSAGTITLVAD